LIVSWARRLASTGGIGLLALLAPLASADAQNLDAGKSAAQIFAEACSGCHRSPREVRGNASASFLREHYTTGNDMASTIAAYLAGSGGGPGAAQPKQKSAPTAASRDTADPPRRPQQPEPKVAAPAAAASPPTGSRTRTSASTNEAKLPNPAPPAPTRPALEDFEE
jgi:hypothetical protein